MKVPDSMSAASIIGLVAGGVLYEAIGSATFALSAVAFLTAVIAGLLMPSSPGSATASVTEA
jgi:hypothetical protein